MKLSLSLASRMARGNSLCTVSVTPGQESYGMGSRLKHLNPDVFCAKVILFRLIFLFYVSSGSLIWYRRWWRERDGNLLKYAGVIEPFSHIFFVDDLFLFAMANKKNARSIRDVLACFCAASGLKIIVENRKFSFQKGVVGGWTMKSRLSSAMVPQPTLVDIWVFHWFMGEWRLVCSENWLIECPVDWRIESRDYYPWRRELLWFNQSLWQFWTMWCKLNGYRKGHAISWIN